MLRSSPLVRILDGTIELGWLFVLLVVPGFFNTHDYRAFEPDKLVLLRNTVLVMVVAFAIKAVYVAPAFLGRSRRADLEAGAAAFSRRSLRSALRARPIVLAAAAFGAAYLLATATSIIPRISFWGSYDRLQGAYTYLSYVALFLLIATHLRSRAQLERLVTAAIFASAAPAAYSWLQHYSNDPLVWANPDLALRTPSTMGNPIFLAAYLLMVIPLTLYRIVLRGAALLGRDRSAASSPGDAWAALGLAGYGLLLLLQLVAFGFAGSRGPALGLLAALVIGALCLAIRLRIAWLLRTGVAFALLVLLVFGATNTVLKHKGDTPSGGLSRFLYLLPSESGTSEVRSLLWKSAGPLIGAHPLTGCGPEVLIFCWYKNYPPELRRVERANAAPDRSHDETIDVILMSGLLGLLAYLAWLGSTIAALVALLRRASDLRTVALLSALLGAFVGHIVEGVTGIAFASTLTLMWTISAVATALWAASVRQQAPLFDAPPQPVPGDEPGPEPAFARQEPPAIARSANRPTRNTRSEQSRRDRARNERPLGPGRRPSGRSGVPSYGFASAAGRLGGGALALFAGVCVAAVVAIAGAIGLFAHNVDEIRADASYRTGLNYEQAAGQVIDQSPNNYTVALHGYQLALAAYQQARDLRPEQDSYSLYLGKTYLEYAQALLKDRTGTYKKGDVEDAIRNALTVFLQATKENPLNPDHPRNIAKLYDFWGQTAFNQADPAKLRLSQQYFARAATLAPHNPDILHEWAAVTIQLGISQLQDKSAATQRQTRALYAEARDRLLKARDLDPSDDCGAGCQARGNIYRDLGTVYSQFAQWAEADKQPALAHDYYVKTRDAWLLALKYAAERYQSVYPRLAALYLEKLSAPCDALTYARYGQQSISQGTLESAFGTDIQQLLANAGQRCPKK